MARHSQRSTLADLHHALIKDKPQAKAQTKTTKPTSSTKHVLQRASTKQSVSNSGKASNNTPSGRSASNIRKQNTTERPKRMQRLPSSDMETTQLDHGRIDELYDSEEDLEEANYKNRKYKRVDNRLENRGEFLFGSNTHYTSIKYTSSKYD